MLPVQDRRCAAFTVLVSHTVLALIHSCTGQSQLVGPSQPMVALAGDDIMLPCHLEPPVDAFDMLVEWARPDLDPRFVLVWRDGVELQSKKHPSYRGRTSLFTDQLKHGNVSLKLSPVTRSDEGTYRCFIPDFPSGPMIQLVVGVASSPVIQIISSSSSGVLLQCESAGWYPEPELLWLDAEGRVLPAGPAETLRRPDGLYNVSSRVTVEKKHGSSFTCRVQQKSIKQSRETHLHVPDHFFVVPSTPAPPAPPAPPAVLIGSAVGCAALLLVSAVFFAVWKWRLKKSRNRRRSPEDGAETLTAQRENSGLQLLMEGGEEREPLMAGREEEKDADGGGENDVKSSNKEGVLLTRTEGETKHKQDMSERQALNNGGKEQQTEPVKQDSGLQLVTEGGEEREEKEAGREEEKDADGGGEESRSQREHKDKTQQDPLVTEADREFNDEHVPPIPAEQQQDTTGRRISHDEREQTGGEDSGLQNLNTDQEELKQQQITDELKQQDTTDDEDERETKIRKMREMRNKKTELQQVRKGGSGFTGQKQQEKQKGRKRPDLNSRRNMNPEMPKIKEGGRDETELKTQREDETQNLSGVRIHEESKTEHEDGNKQENLSLNTNTTERKAEEETEERERELQSEEQENTKRDEEQTDVFQQVLDGSKQEAEHEEERGNEQEENLSLITNTTERKAEEETEERERELQSENTQRGEEQTDVFQQVLDGSKQEDKRGNEADITAVTERKQEKETETKEERMEKDRKSQRQEKEKRAKERRVVISQKIDPNQIRNTSRNQEGEQQNITRKQEKETETKEERMEKDRKLQSQRQTQREEKEKRAKERRVIRSQKMDPNQTKPSPEENMEID